MDKIWYRNHSKSEVIGRCGGDEEKRMTTQNRQQSNAKKTKTNPAHKEAGFITSRSYKLRNYLY